MLSIFLFANYITCSVTNLFSISETHPCLFGDLQLLSSVTQTERSGMCLKNATVIPGGEDALENHPGQALKTLTEGTCPA